MLLALWPALLLQWMLAEAQRGQGRAEPPLPLGCSPDSRKYKLVVSRSVSVQEGQCALVSCHYPASQGISRPVSGYWFQAGAKTDRDLPVAASDQHPVQERTRGRFRLLLDAQTNNCSLHITDAQKADSGSYFFRVDSRSVQWNYCANVVSVKVTALTHTPDIFIPATLMPGHPRNLTCSVPWACEWGTPPIFSWTSAARTSLGPRTNLSSVLTLSPRPQEHGTNLTCQVMFPGVGVTVESTVQLNVTGSHKTEGTMSGVLLGALGGAAVTALLAIGVCTVFFIVKTLKKKAPRVVQDEKDAEPAARPASLDHPSEAPAAPQAAPASGQKQELHYAAINFHPRQESSTTEYAQIRTHGRAGASAGPSQYP